METVSKVTYPGDRLNASGGCETAVTARSRTGWMKFRKCSEILEGRRFSLKKKKGFLNCVRSAFFFQFSSVYSPHHVSMYTSKSINTSFGKKKNKKKQAIKYFKCTQTHRQQRWPRIDLLVFKSSSHP